MRLVRIAVCLSGQCRKKRASGPVRCRWAVIRRT